MEMEFQKMKVQSLKGQFIAEIESMIVSGKLLPGERLPPERELAKQVGVSRSIVNSGLLDLAAKGFLTVVPRRGTFIADFRNEGTLGILTTLLHYLGEEMDDKLFFDTNLTRQVLEIEAARAAAANRSDEDIETLTDLMERARKTTDKTELISLKIRFHHRIAVASRNMVLCLLLRSFSNVIERILSYFFEIPGAMDRSFASHTRLLEEIMRGDPDGAAAAAKRIFTESERIVRDFKREKTGSAQ